ncbi:MAG: hypothetical protein QOH25_1637 [Acidobacteriota bacterium]|nr:hypothetical protein [Acidobacteriota bacterium]
MKRSIVFCLFLSLTGTALAIDGVKPAQSDAALQTFWQKFKTAVISGNKEAISRLSKFPIEMSYGISSVKNKTELRRRYRQVFNEQSNAAQCFAQKQPEIDAANPKRFTIACPNEAGDEVVIYDFALTRTGWKFAGLDNINE